MSDLQEPLPYAELMPDIYRFAFLMTGSTEVAAEVLRRAVERAARTLRQVRDPSRAKRWLFSQARLDSSGAAVVVPVPPGMGTAPAQADEAAARNGSGSVSTNSPPDAPVPAVYNDQPRQLALVFAVLPERERCALALFYLYLFTRAELAELMDLKPRDLGIVLTHGRALLQRNRTLSTDLLAAAVAASVSA